MTKPHSWALDAIGQVCTREGCGMRRSGRDEKVPGCKGKIARGPSNPVGSKWHNASKELRRRARIEMTFEPSTLELLERLAAGAGVTRSAFVESLITEAGAAAQSNAVNSIWGRVKRKARRFGRLRPSRR